MTPQIPFWQSAVFWSKTGAQVASVLLVLSTYVLTIPGLPQWVALAVGGVVVALTELGYQQHSATVRAAELANPQPQAWWPPAPVTNPQPPAGLSAAAALASVPIAPVSTGAPAMVGPTDLFPSDSPPPAPPTIVSQ